MKRIVKAIGASIGVVVCFFYLGCGGIQVAEASHNAVASSLSITTKILPSGIAGSPYVAILDATGGTPGYTWSVKSGSLPSGLSIAATTGIISGTPKVKGDFSFSVALADASNPSQTKTTSMAITIARPPLAITALSLPNASVGTAYSQKLTATGGTPSYKWSIASGSLPAGLRLATSGLISGTPTTSGSANFTATVRDSERPEEEASLPMSISVASAAPAASAPLKIMTSALPSVASGTPYSQALQASGGKPSYSWSITSGKLPAGLTLSPSTGAISGTPVTTGTSAFTATVSDSDNPALTASTPLAIAVAPTALVITSATLPSVTVGASYSQALQASGGTAPYTWSISSGKLPAGLNLAASGVISGTPTTSGTSTFTATLTDSSSPVQTTSATLAIVTTATALTMRTSSLPSVTVGISYSQGLQVSGGTAPYIWSITSGKLPAGLSLTSSTGNISGTSTASGTSTFTATVTDSSSPVQTASTTLAIVTSPTALTISSSALPSVTVGASYSQGLQASGGTAPYTWSITSGKLPAGLSLASSGAISGTPTASGTSTFTATVTDRGNPAQATSASLTIVATPTALTITSSTLPAVTVGTGYSQTLQATGGSAPYTWSITSGQLPSGLSISAGTGTISGTPASSGASNFTATVSDSSSPTQTNSVALTIATTASPLTITSSTLLSGTNGSPYSQALQASGGTPAYTWSITSGNLPSGLTLASTTGTISGAPTASGVSNFTATVSDNGNPMQTQSVAVSITVVAAQAAGPGTTWYIRPDGGTRYSSSVTIGQCDGKADTAYPGSGTNQSCAYNDFRYLWSDNSGAPNAWVIAGGDTVIIRGCTALGSQVNADNPHCRIGYDNPTNGNAPNYWCGYGNANSGCFNPPIPAGSADAHTRILGANYASCNTGGATNPKIYASNLTQIYGGFGLGYVLNLENTSYVDVQCIEITAHNGVCTTFGIPRYPRGCNTGVPYDDFANSGILTNNATSNVTFQDLYIHGLSSAGLFGPIGGPITMTRMFIGFNASAGWNFDDGSSTPDAPGSSITANYVLMEGNGFAEEYPIVDAFPALVGYDPQSQGFGDSWSGQNTVLDSFYCNHCDNLYNTKDAFIGPHTWVSALTIVNSTNVGNMGQSWKWGGGTSPNNTTFQNNLTVGNCNRMSQPLPGAPANYNQYLSNFCRAAGNVVASVIPTGSTWNITNNTWVFYSPTLFDIACPAAVASCPSTVNVTNNIFLGYYNPTTPYGPFIPALYYIDPSVVLNGSNNIEYGLRNGDPCGGTILCVDPLLVDEPAQSAVPPESALDNFDFHLTSTSPAIGAGGTYSALPATDYYGTPTTNPPVIGAINP